MRISRQFPDAIFFILQLDSGSLKNWALVRLKRPCPVALAGTLVGKTGLLIQVLADIVPLPVRVISWISTSYFHLLRLSEYHLSLPSVGRTISTPAFVTAVVASTAALFTPLMRIVSGGWVGGRMKVLESEAVTIDDGIMAQAIAASINKQKALNNLELNFMKSSS
jgi:hypothetical protein